MEQDIAVSAYYDIKKEYRVVILDGEVELVYAKNTPFVIGDGQSTIHTLLLQYMEENKCFIDPSSIDSKRLSSVLSEGDHYRIGWKSNLSKGAIPQIVSEGEKKTKLMQLAKMSVQALAIRFASVDIIETEHEFRILEVNSGIMMEGFVRADQTAHYPIAKHIYQKAVSRLFAPK